MSESDYMASANFADLFEGSHGIYCIAYGYNLGCRSRKKSNTETSASNICADYYYYFFLEQVEYEPIGRSKWYRQKANSNLAYRDLSYSETISWGSGEQLHFFLC